MRSMASSTLAVWALFAGTQFALPARAELAPPLKTALAIEPRDRDIQTMVLRVSAGAASILVGYERDGGDSASVHLLSPPDVDSLDDEQRELWEPWEAGEREDDVDGGSDASVSFGGYDTEAIAHSVGNQAEPAGRRDGLHWFRFSPQSVPVAQTDADMLDTALDNMIAEVGVDDEHGHVACLRYELDQSFKPNLFARVSKLRVTARFVHDPRIDGPRMDMLELRMEGSALFSDFEEAQRIEVVELEYSVDHASD